MKKILLHARRAPAAHENVLCYVVGWGLKITILIVYFQKYFRPSVFFTTRMDGCLDAWDILYQQRAPLLSIKVSDEPLHTLKVHEAGCLVATGCEGGNVALLELAEGLASAHRNDKTSVTAVSIQYKHYSY